MLFYFHVVTSVFMIRLLTILIDAIIVLVNDDLIGIVFHVGLVQMEPRHRRMSLSYSLNKYIVAFLEVLLGILKNHILIRDYLGHL